jgi:hypothetical protein
MASNRKIAAMPCTSNVSAKGSQKKFTFSSVEAPVWKSAKVMPYQNIASFRKAARRDASALENVKLFFRGP